MIQTLRLLTCLNEATVTSSLTRKDVEWQAEVLWFWERRFNSAPDPGYRRAYAAKLHEEQTRMAAMRLIQNLNNER